MNYKGSILRDRLIAFSIDISDLAEEISGSYLGEVLGKQMIRAATSAALNHGEATSASSRNELIYRLNLALRETREVSNALKILQAKSSGDCLILITRLLAENDELCAMLFSSIRTAGHGPTEPRK
jgi:four helix bundle protein